MLYRLHSNILIVGLLSIGLLGALALERSFCLMTLGTLLAYVTQLGLLMYFSRDERQRLSEKVLFFTVLLYSLFIGTAFMLISVYYSGDTFMLSKSDAWFYYENSMKTRDIGLAANVERLVGRYEFDDCGALIFDSLMMAIIPSKFFLNAIYMITGAFSALMLFRIGLHFMPRIYAYLAALAYGTSSFLIFFHCSFLKESIFIFLVVCALYYFYKAVFDQKQVAYAGVALSLGLILFFRPAISALLLMAFLIYFAVSQRGKAISLMLYILIAGLLVVFFTTIQGLMVNYTGGDMDALVDYGRAYDYSSGFSRFVAWFAAPFGPFPSLFPKVAGQPILINYYGAGLTYRLFLAVPLWLGVYFLLRQRETKMIPLAAFVLLGMLATGYVMATLELRKVMTHIPFTYILAFYGLYQWERREKGLIAEPLFHGFAIGVLILWTLIRG